jgi:hypothetical protein
MNTRSPRHTLVVLARLLSFVLALVLTVASIMFWSTSNAVVIANGLICLLALLLFAVLPRQHLANLFVRIPVIGLAIAAQIVNALGLLHSIRNIDIVDLGPIIMQIAMAILLLIMLTEALASWLRRVAV